MRIETTKNLDIENIGIATQTIEAGIDESSIPFLFEMLSKTLYSAPIESICRELTSNCFDSHIAANVDDPVIIRKGYDEEGEYISFIDVGTGMSPKTITEIYMNYFSSSKRETNEQIGGFGLGSKSPFSYTDMFYVTTISDKHLLLGIDSKTKAPFAPTARRIEIQGFTYKYQYILSKGTKKPELDLLNVSKTNEHPGTEIRIYLEPNTNDSYHFRSALEKQLCYFDNVYFDNLGIENDYNIFEGKYFKFRNRNSYSSEMHIALGKVVYPIDWKQIGKQEVNVAVAVKFEIGELQVTPNREQLRYTPESIQLIKKRIDKAVDELIEMFNKQNEAYDSFYEWYSKKDNNAYISFITENNTSKLYLYGFENINKKNRYKYLIGMDDMLDKSDILTAFYDYVGHISNGQLKKERYHWDTTRNLVSRHIRCYISDDYNTSKEKDWLVSDGIIYRCRSRFKYEDIKYQFKISYRNNRGTNYYFNLGIGLKLYKLKKAIQSEINDKCQTYRELTPEEKLSYKEYLRSNNRTLQKRLEGKIFVNSISANTGYDWYLDKKTYVKNDQIPGIEHYKGLVIYGFKEDEEKLYKALTMLCLTRPKMFDNRYNTVYSKALNIIRISKQNEKYFKNKDRMTHVDNLFGDNAIFRDMASAFKVEQFFNNIEQHNGQHTAIYIRELSKINKEVGDILQKMYDFYKSVANRDSEIYNYRYKRESLMKEVMEVANTFDLFNPRIEMLFDEVEHWFKGIEIIRYVAITDKTLPYILKTLYTNKKKLNVEYYQKVLNTDKSQQLRIDFDKQVVNTTKFKQLTNTAIL